MPTQPYQSSNSVRDEKNTIKNTNLYIQKKSKLKSRISRIVTVVSICDEEEISIKKLFAYVDERVSFLIANEQSIDVNAVYQELSSCLDALVKQRIKISAKEAIHLNRLARSIAGVLLYCLCQKKYFSKIVLLDIEFNELKSKLFYQFYYLEITSSLVKSKNSLAEDHLVEDIDKLLVAIGHELAQFDVEEFFPQKFATPYHISLRRDFYTARHCHLAQMYYKQGFVAEAEKNTAFIDWERIDKVYSLPKQNLLQEISESEILSNLMHLNLEDRFLWIFAHLDFIDFYTVEKMAYRIFKSAVFSEQAQYFVAQYFVYNSAEKSMKLLKAFMHALAEKDAGCFLNLYASLSAKAQDLFYDLCDELSCSSPVAKKSIYLVRALYQLNSPVFNIYSAVSLFNTCDLDQLVICCETIVVEKILASCEEKCWGFVFGHKNQVKDFSLLRVLQINLVHQWNHERIIEKILAEESCLLKISVLSEAEAVEFLKLVFSCCQANTKLLIDALRVFFEAWKGCLESHIWAELLQEKLDLILEILDVASWDKLGSIVNYIHSRFDLSYKFLTLKHKSSPSVNQKKLIQHLLAQEYHVNHLSDGDVLQLLNLGLDVDAITGGISADIFCRLVRLIFIRSEILVDFDSAINSNLIGILQRMCLTDLVSIINCLFINFDFSKAKILFALILLCGINIEQLIAELKLKNSKAAEVYSYLYLIDQQKEVSLKISYDVLQDLLDIKPCNVLRVLPVEKIVLVIERALLNCCNYLSVIIDKFNKIVNMDMVRKWYLLKSFVFAILKNDDLLKKINNTQYEILIARLVALTVANTTLGQTADEFYLDFMCQMREFVLYADKYQNKIARKHFAEYVNAALTTKTSALFKILQDEIQNTKKKFFTDEFLLMLIDEIELVHDELLPLIADYFSRCNIHSQLLPKIFKLLFRKPEYVFLVRQNKFGIDAEQLVLAFFILLQNHNISSSLPYMLLNEAEDVLQRLVLLISQKSDRIAATNLIRILSGQVKYSFYIQNLMKMLIHTCDLSQLFLLEPELQAILYDNWNSYLKHWYMDDVHQKAKLSYLQKILNAKVFFIDRNRDWKKCFYEMLKQACIYGMTVQECLDLLLRMEIELSKQIAQDLFENWDLYTKLWICPRARAQFLSFLYHSKWFYQHVLYRFQPKDLSDFKLLISKEMLLQAVLPSEVSSLCQDVVLRAEHYRHELLSTACGAKSLLRMQANVQRYSIDAAKELNQFIFLLERYRFDDKLSMQEKCANLSDYFCHIQANDASRKSLWNSKILSCIIKDPRYFFGLINQSKSTKQIDFSELNVKNLEEAIYVALYSRCEGQPVLSVKQNFQIQDYLQVTLTKSTEKSKLLLAYKRTCVKQQRMTSKFNWFWKFMYDVDVLNLLDSGDEYFSVVSQRLRYKQQSVVKQVEENNLKHAAVYPSPLKPRNIKVANDAVLSNKRLEYK